MANIRAQMTNSRNAGAKMELGKQSIHKGGDTNIFFISVFVSAFTFSSCS